MQSYTLLAKIPEEVSGKDGRAPSGMNRYFLAVPKHGAKSAEVSV